MSTPFPLEDQAQQESLAGYVDPWSGAPPTHWYSGLGFSEDTAYLGPFYRVLQGAGQGAAKGEALLAGLARPLMNAEPSESTSFAEEQEHLQERSDPGLQAAQDAVVNRIKQDARDRVKAMTPDPATTGSVAQTVTGLVSGAYRATIGAAIGGPAGAAALLGSTEAQQRFQELRDKGVDAMTAFNMSALTGIESGAGALIPMGFGGTLLKKILTGAAANVGFGITGRYLDHGILADAGYKDMAEQQQVWDTAQMVTDGVLGGFFGALGHAHQEPDQARIRALQETLNRAANQPGAEDAALTLNLALRDRAASPGVAATPGAAGAHQAAMEQSLEALVKGEPVNVSGSGMEDGHPFVPRAANESPEGVQLIHDVIASSGILDETQRLDELELALGRRLRGEPEPVQTPAQPESVTSEAPESGSGYTVGERELTDEERQTFQGLRSEVSGEQELVGPGGRESAEPGPEDAGRSGTAVGEPAGAAREPVRESEPAGQRGEPLRVFRGSAEPLAEEHFDLEALGRASGHPSSGLGVFFTNEAADAARYGPEVTAHHLDIRNPKVIPAEELPGFDSPAAAHAYREKLRKEGYDGLVIDGSHLGGPVQFVAFKPEQVRAAGAARGEAMDPAAQAVAEQPGMKIATGDGGAEPAAIALQRADQAVAKAEAETPGLMDALATCFNRQGVE